MANMDEGQIPTSLEEVEAVSNFLGLAIYGQFLDFEYILYLFLVLLPRALFPKEAVGLFHIEVF
jgi:hypothetical protein